MRSAIAKPSVQLCNMFILRCVVRGPDGSTPDQTASPHCFVFSFIFNPIKPTALIICKCFIFVSTCIQTYNLFDAFTKMFSLIFALLAFVLSYPNEASNTMRPVSCMPQFPNTASCIFKCF